MPSLIEIQLDVLLARNARGRLTTTRDPSPRPAPRVFLGRSPDGNVWGVRDDLDRMNCGALDRLCAAEPSLARVEAAQVPACRQRAAELLEPIEFEWRGPAYALPADLPRDDRARVVTAAESGEWVEAYPWLAEHFDAIAPVVIAFDQRQPAAVCHSPRGCTDAAAEAGVETREGFRGRGLASAAVACWARAVQRTGRLALYSTSWENAASQGVARRLGARLYGENWHLT